jgi:hypothetical protein
MLVNIEKQKGRGGEGEKRRRGDNSLLKVLSLK